MGPKQTYTELNTTYWCKGIWLFLPGFQWCSVPDPVSHATYWCQRYLCPPGFPWCSVPYHILMLGISMSAWVSMVQCQVSVPRVSCRVMLLCVRGFWREYRWLVPDVRSTLLTWFCLAPSPQPGQNQTEAASPTKRERGSLESVCRNSGRSFTTYAQLSSCHKEKIDDWPRGGLAGAQADYGAKSELRSGNLQGIVSSAALKRVSSHLRHPQSTTWDWVRPGNGWQMVWLGQTDTS